MIMKNILITGASGGMGKATCKLLTSLGYNVFGVDATSSDDFVGNKFFTANLCDDAIKACLEAVGPKKLLFGSDLPYAIMRMYRIVEDGYYINIVRRGEFGDITGVAHMRETDEKDLTLMIYEQIRALKRMAIF